MSETLSQQEIDALLRMGESGDGQEAELTSDERDVLGEIGNISMGTAATTLSVLLNRKVMITTPVVSITSMSELEQEYPSPCIAVEVEYTEGLEGTNLLVMRDEDVKLITDLLMGGSGTYAEGKLNEMHLSAISEVMNQMIGSSSTSLATVFKHPINISTPKATVVDLNREGLNIFSKEDPLIKVDFRMEIEGLLESHIMQVMPLSFGKMMVEKLFSSINGASKPEQANQIPTQTAVQSVVPETGVAAKEITEQRINVKPVQFQSFDKEEPDYKSINNIDIILDIPLQVTVELGRTKKEVRDILKLGTGSIIELDKLAGEPVDILVNGKYIARGEVVVIDENFGVRVNDIISPSMRIPKMG
ncbi:MAG: flagellar motor switch phosphatase FliY [Firmicutes bacterium]|nr:flagellar motor switch phosphatase FliY [Bacillota bacterium]